MNVTGIIVAAGSGTRLGKSTVGGGGPKALRLLAGHPLVRWSARRLVAGGVQKLIIVCLAEHAERFESCLRDLGVELVFCEGGNTRQESVISGLEHVDENCDVVLVHDAARPLVPPSVVESVTQTVAAGNPVVIPVIPVADTIRRLTDEGSEVVDRSYLRAVQTPQGFDPKVLIACHGKNLGSTLTDDAGVCEVEGYEVKLVEGDQLAMKITHPLDFAIAEALAASGAIGEPFES